MRISGVYNLETKQNTFEYCKAEHYNDRLLDICLISDDSCPWAEKFADLYKNKHSNCVNDINCLFLAAVYEKENMSLHIFADITTSPLNLYYTVYKNQLYYSTSLKWILKKCEIRREINLPAAKAFLANGYVFGENTLVQNVYKLNFGSELVASDGNVEQKEYFYQIRTVSAEKGKEKLIDTIQKCTQNLMNANGDIYMPLSGGYDSNMIALSVRKATERTIHAFTVGGKTGKNEISAVEENVSNMSNTILHTSLVDESFFDKFSDIVWRLDGSVYESGVFLQYALASTAASAGAEYMICGESSDEVQSEYYYDSLNRVLNHKAKENEKYYVYADPFIGTNMVVLKKSSVMLNSFGITGRYPFKSKNFVELASSLYSLNGSDKKYYKSQCAKIFNPKILKNIKTTGGTTNANAAITDDKQEKIKPILESCQLIKNIDRLEYPIFTCKRTKKLRRKQGFSRLISEIKDNGLINGFKKVKKSASGQNSLLIKKLYLLIFYELFISGKYNNYFEDDGITITTSEVIKQYEKI